MMANLLNYIVWDPDPILAHLGPISIRYYATCWLVGLLLGYLMMHRLYKEQKLGEDKFEPLFIYLFVGILAGVIGFPELLSIANLSMGEAVILLAIVVFTCTVF